MSPLTLNLFGAMTAASGDNRLHFPTDKVRALLAYIAIEQGRPHRREALAALLWPDQPDTQARRNLRLTLHRLKQSLDGDVPKRSETFLTVNRTIVQWQADDAIVDYSQFVALLTEIEAHPHPQLTGCHACLGRMETAVSILHGELLSGMALPDADPFEEWLLIQREFIHHRALRLFAALTESYEVQGDYNRAFTYAQRQLTLEPWYEAAHRQAMRALALAGDRDRAMAQFETCRTVLWAELGVEPVAETAVLHQQIRDNSLIANDQPQTIPLHNLPTDLTPFVGRTDELERITTLLSDPDSRLLTLVGPGGMGKTRLAVQAAHRFAALSPTAPLTEPVEVEPVEAIYFVPLETAVSPQTAVFILAEKLGIALSVDGDPLPEVLHFLRGQACLLLLDNLEQLDGAATLVNTILQETDQVAILATSREPLGLRSEQRLPLSGLPDALALILFVQSARQMVPNFRLDAAAETAVTQLCHLVDGLPLALELAAGWVRVMEPAAILQEVKKNLAFLVTRHHEVPERHRSLQAIFNQTWTLLPPHLQQVLAQTAVFPADFTLTALQAVLPASSLLDMAVLLDKSLLRHTDDNRYTLHPLIKQFAAAYATPDERWQLLFSRYYLAMVAAQETAVFGPTPQATLHQIRRDLLNVGQAWEWGIAHHLWAELGAALAALARFFQMTGRFAIAESGLEQALLALAGADEVVGETAVFHCHLYLQHSHFLGQQGKYNRAITQAEAALALATHLSDDCLVAQAQARIGEWQRHRGQYTAAIAALTTAIPLFGDQPSASFANAHNELGFAHLERGEYAAAQVEFQTALALYETLADLSGTAVTLGNLGYLEHLQANFDAARNFLERALSMAQEMGDKQSIVKHTLGLSRVSLQQGDMVQAQIFQQEALALATTIGYLRGVVTARRQIGDIYLMQNKLDDAEKAYRRVLALAHKAQLTDLSTYATGNLGVVYARRGDAEAAITQYQAAIALCQQSESPVQLNRHLSNLGSVYRRLGQYEAAQESFSHSLKIGQQTGNRLSEAYALMNLGAVYRHQKKFKLALAYFEQALVNFEALGFQDGVAKAQGFLGLLHQTNGEFAAAIVCLEGALAHSEALGDELTASVWRNNLAEVYLEMGEWETAVPYIETALLCFQSLNSKAYLTTTLLLKTRLLLHQGEPEAAHLVFTKALALAEAVGEPRQLADAQIVAALVAAALA